MIKAIIFDLDGMIHFTKRLWSEHFCSEYNIPKQIMDNFFENEFQDCLLGKSDTKQLLKKYISDYDLDLTVDLIFDSWFNYGLTDNNILDLVEKLKKKGITCALCTNNERYRIMHFKEKHEFDKLFDVIIASSDIGHKKPSDEMFSFIVKKLKIPKEQILFCDDDLKNCKAATLFGFKVHQYQDIEKFKEVLKNEI